MGIEIQCYRARIGLFIQPDKRKFVMHGLKLSKRVCSNGLRWILFLSIILILGGDIELNPGPMRGRGGGAKGSNAGAADSSGGLDKAGDGMSTRSRQRTLSSFSFSSSQPPPTTTSRRYSNVVSGSPTRDENRDISVMDFLRDMRADIDAQNQRVNRDLSQVNLKVDSISDSILSLRAENEQLRTENRAIRSQMEAMKVQLDNLEGHSRRNNLRINGIAGSINENWSDSEAKVREFIKNDLDLPAMETVQIERAHRIKSKDPKKCTILVKFNSYKDRECILNRSKSVLGKDSDVYVKPDYTERVARHRRILGSRMLRERENGNYATIRHDKLIVDDQIFRYDDLLNDTVCIGKRRRRINPRGQPHGVVNNNTTEGQRLDEEDHVISDVESNTTAQGADWSAHEDEGVD